MFQALDLWTRAHPLRSSALMLVVAVCASLRFQQFGLERAISAALLFATIVSLVHCKQSGFFRPDSRRHSTYQ